MLSPVRMNKVPMDSSHITQKNPTKKKELNEQYKHRELK